MCGIGGIINLQRKNIDLIAGAKLLSSTLRHRGPDDEGFLFFNAEKHLCAFDADTQKASMHASLNFSPQRAIADAVQDYTAVLVHRRLAIIDTGAGGHQPMCDEREELWVTYNGEIYNYVELRIELETQGYRFRTSSDTEVLLNGYRAWGVDCLKRFNGMFAFALWDTRQKRIFCGRDRSGVKPFYYYFRDGFFCFASELKALKALPFVETGLNERAVHQYLLYNLLEREPEGFLKNIFELQPGAYLLLDLSLQTVAEKRYFHSEINERFVWFDQKKFDSEKGEVKQLVTDAILKRLRSDVPVGCCLSGGIDSSIIAGVIAGQTKNFNAFTAAFPNEKIDESSYAKEVADATNATWHTVTPTGTELIRDYERMIFALDIPIWSTSTYAQFRVMQLAKDNNIKVVLDGQGGDELFAGYPHYYATWVNELLRHFHLGDAFGQINAMGLTRYLKENAKRTVNYNRNREYLQSDFVKAYSSQSTESIPKNLNGHLQHDFFGGLLKTYLRCEDRCSMHHSVESRTPFSDDTALIEKAFSLPGSFKIQRGVSKFILRESLKDVLPRSVYSRTDKMGFVTPHNQWLRELLTKYGELQSHDVLHRFFNEKFWKHYNHLSAGGNHLPNEENAREESIAFKALTFSVWYKSFGL